MRKLRGRLTYANVMATAAVFIALGGASYAATQLPKNSVGTKQLKKNAVNSAKVKNGSLTGGRLHGRPGPKGQGRAAWPQGRPRRDQCRHPLRAQVKLATGGSSSSIASCNPGEPVTGGGYQALEGTNSSEFHLTRNRPGLPVGEEFPPPGDGAAATGWLVSIENNTGNEIKFRAYVQCASP